MLTDCGCHHCLATDRLYALAAVFEEAGDHSAADCCREWAERAGRKDPQGQRMALAIIYGRAS
jgi:hypothetical protein